MELVGLAKGADHSTLGELLRAQTKESIMELARLNAEFVDWAWAGTDRRRLLHAGWTEYFFDSTQVEVYGKNIEGARINYQGNLALCCKCCGRDCLL